MKLQRDIIEFISDFLIIRQPRVRSQNFATSPTKCVFLPCHETRFFFLARNESHETSFFNRHETSFFNPPRNNFVRTTTKRNEFQTHSRAWRNLFQHAQFPSYVRHSAARSAISRQEQVLKKLITYVGDIVYFLETFKISWQMVILEFATDVSFTATFYPSWHWQFRVLRADL